MNLAPELTPTEVLRERPKFKARDWDNPHERAAWKWLLNPTDPQAMLGQFLMRWKADPIRYANEAHGCVLMPYQGQILLDLADAPVEVYEFYGLDPTFPKRQVLAPSGHGLGKTRLTAIGIQWHKNCFAFSKTLVTAPTAPQLTGQLWGEIKKVNRKLKERFPQIADEWDILASSITHRDPDNGDWGVWGRTSRADAPEGLQGAHALDVDDEFGDLAAIWGFEQQQTASGGMMIVCEEASGVPDEIREVLQGALSEPGARFLSIGNPTRADGWFANDMDKIGEYAVHTLDCRMSNAQRVYTQRYEDTAGRVHDLRIRGFVEPRYWEGILKDCGGDEESDYFRRRVAGKKPTSNVDQIILKHWVERAEKREPDPSCVDAVAIVSLDFGLTSDKHAIAVKKGWDYPLVNEWLIPENPDDVTMEAARRGIDAQAQFNAKYIIGDSNGVGRGAMEYLSTYFAERPELGVEVIHFNSGLKAIDENRYFRRRDEMWHKHGRRFFSDPRASIPPEVPGLIKQLTAPGFKELNKRIKVETKEEIEKRTGQRSGNAADAILQALTVTIFAEKPKVDTPPVHPKLFEKHFARWKVSRFPRDVIR